MNETMQTILTRRSTRKFKVQEIPQTDLDQILKAALCSQRNGKTDLAVYRGKKQKKGAEAGRGRRKDTGPGKL